MDLVDFLREWQTLIGSFIALVAAWIAVRPVWRQLNRMEIQTDAMVRDAAVARIRDAEWSLDHMGTPIRNFLDQATNDLEPYEDEEIEISAESSHNWAGTLGVARTTFLEMAATRLDIASLEKRKEELGAAAERLISTLYAISAPVTVDPEEHGLDEGDIAKLEEDAVAAQSATPELMTLLRRALSAMDDERKQEIALLRKRLRAIDDRLAEG